MPSRPKSTIHARDSLRRARLVAYLMHELNGSRTALQQRSGLTKGRVSQLLDPGEPFGERASASLAQALDLPAAFFETDQPPPPPRARLVMPIDDHAPLASSWPDSGGGARRLLAELAQLLSACDSSTRDVAAQMLALYARDPRPSPIVDAIVVLLEGGGGG